MTQMVDKQENRIRELERQNDDLKSACAEYQQEIFKLREQVRDLEYVYGD